MTQTPLAHLTRIQDLKKPWHSHNNLQDPGHDIAFRIYDGSFTIVLSTILKPNRAKENRTIQGNLANLEKGQFRNFYDNLINPR